MMIEKFKIMSEYIKDMSSETPDIKTYLFVKDNIHKYHLNIEITSQALKDKIVQVNTSLKFSDNEPNELKSNFEMIYATIIKVEDSINNKEDLQKIVLCDVQNKIYKKLEKSFLDMLVSSGYTNVKFDKKIDFDKLYKEKFN